MALVRSSAVSWRWIGVAGLRSNSAAIIGGFHSCQFSTKASEKERKVLPKVTLFSKPTGCSLCVVAKKALKPYINRFELVEIDITLPENKPWFEKYKYEIPVVHFEGQYLMKHRVDTKRLESTLISWEKDRK